MIKTIIINIIKDIQIMYEMKRIEKMRYTNSAEAFAAMVMLNQHIRNR